MKKMEGNERKRVSLKSLKNPFPDIHQRLYGLRQLTQLEYSGPLFQGLLHIVEATRAARKDLINLLLHLGI